jgi:hypothetical protein
MPLKKLQCQCLPTCRETPLENNVFCEKHSKRCPRISPLSGYEPAYEPDRWNKVKELKETHNCFAYAFNVHDPKQVDACKKDPECNTPFHQPGSASGHPKFKGTRLKTCPDMIARLLGDNPGLKMTTFETKCPAHTSKIGLVVDPDEDYHFYRQDKNRYWSHKPGGTEVTNKDATGRDIYDPALASRNYTDKESSLDYDTFCGYFCLARDKPLHIKVGGYKKTRRNYRRGKRQTRSARRASNHF